MTETVKIEDTPQSDTPQAVSTDEPSYGMKLKKGFGKIKALFVEEEEIFPTYMPTSTDNGKKKTVWKVPYRLIFGTAFILLVLAAVSIRIEEKNVGERGLLRNKKDKSKNQKSKEQKRKEKKMRKEQKRKEQKMRKESMKWWKHVLLSYCTFKCETKCEHKFETKCEHKREPKCENKCEPLEDQSLFLKLTEGGVFVLKSGDYEVEIQNDDTTKLQQENTELYVGPQAGYFLIKRLDKNGPKVEKDLKKLWRISKIPDCTFKL